MCFEGIHKYDYLDSYFSVCSGSWLPSWQRPDLVKFRAVRVTAVSVTGTVK